MKTLIITGTYTPKNHRPYNPSKVKYNVVLYGQSPESPAVQFITAFSEELSGYDKLQELSRQKYADYFKTDLFNIVSMDNLNRV